MPSLFDDMDDAPETGSPKEDASMDSVTELKNKMALVIEKVKTLKEDKTRLEARVQELEGMLAAKDSELSFDKDSIKDQINDLLNELETIETG